VTGESTLPRQTIAIPVSGGGAWASLRAWLAARAIDGVETMEDHVYSRTARIGGQPAVVRVTLCPERVAVAVMSATGVNLDDVVARVTRVLDLDRDLAAMRARLKHDPWLATLCDKHVGLRVPGGWDPFELAVRAVLGQQVTIAAARRLASDLVALCGARLPAGIADSDVVRATSTPLAGAGLTRVFPDAEAMASADLGTLRMPGARRAALGALAEAAARDPRLLEPHASLETVIARLRAVKGIGEWTAHYIALRALRHPDAFPFSDIGLLRGATAEAGERPTPAALLRRAEIWRPYRAYAAQLLWAEDADS
jgi:3-methyladenine DNA glycosylase/8-oxoguanine DNA glycosylase